MVSAAMEALKMEEFRSNLLLLLQCGYPEGLPMNQLKGEYKQYFMEEVSPELILPRNFKNNKHWDTLFQMKEFREDFTLFYMGTAVYIKAIRKRNFAEMKLIASLAKHSHLSLVKSADFRCGCCPQDMWMQVAKETAQGPLGHFGPNNANNISSSSTLGHVQVEHSHHQGSGSASASQSQQQPEDIIVKIEPHQMLTNGEDDDTSRGGSGGASTATHHTSDGSIYSIVQQAAHGNHNHPANNYVNGGNIDASSSSTSNTNDGFMLDHQLRVQEQSSPQGQSLQAFASLLNSTGTGGQLPVPDGTGNQPFYTFVIQNGEIKVMQIVSSGAEGTTPNGETSVVPSPNTPPMVTTGPTAKKSLPQKKPAPEATVVKPESESFLCSMPGCGESFVIKQHLQNHERTCALKKYPCPFPGCDRRFKNSKQRHAHMTSRHKGTENAFRCTVPLCTAVFKTMDRLKVHESRCRFKYEQFQLMDLDALEAANNNNPSFTPSNHSSVPNLNSSTESVEPQPTPEPNAAFASLQAASIIERVVVTNAQMPNSSGPVKLENGNPVQHVGNTVEFQGFSTVDLSLVKSEIME